MIAAALISCGYRLFGLHIGYVPVEAVLTILRVTLQVSCNAHLSAANQNDSGIIQKIRGLGIAFAVSLSVGAR